MAIHQVINAVDVNPETVITVNNGDKFIGCNFMQTTQNTTIFSGKTGLQFVDCNLINCVLPGDSKVSQCNIAKLNYLEDEAGTEYIGKFSYTAMTTQERSSFFTGNTFTNKNILNNYAGEING